MYLNFHNLLQPHVCLYIKCYINLYNLSIYIYISNSIFIYNMLHLSLLLNVIYYIYLEYDHRSSNEDVNTTLPLDVTAMRPPELQ